MPQAQNSTNLADTIDSIQTGGSQPALFAPTIGLSGSSIVVTNPSVNGGFVSAYDVYNMGSGQVIASVTGTTFDLSSFPAGEYVFAVKAKGQDFSDSDYSNQIHVAVYSITRNLTDLSADNAAAKIMDGKQYQVTLTPASGTFLPEDISVVMGGRSTDAYSYDSYTGTVTVFGVTGNVIITAAASGVNKLRRPSISLGGSSLTVTPPRYASATAVSVNGTQKYTISGTSSQTYDLSQEYTNYGIYHISAASSASGYADSDPSSMDYYIGAAAVISGGVITLSSIISGVDSLNLYADGVLLDTVPYNGSASWSLNMADYTTLVSDGKHIVELEAVGTGIAPNRSNALIWFKGLAPIYGVSGLFDSNPALTRTDEAVGLTYLVNSSSGAVASDFDHVFPWNKTEIVYTEAGKFVSFPEMYFRIGVDSSSRMTDAAVSEWPSGGGNWFRTEPFLYGCYGAGFNNNKLRSVSGVNRLVANQENCRIYARNNGEGYQLLDLYHRNILVLLWWIEFASKDSDAVMTGRIRNSGYLGGIAVRPCGGTDCVLSPTGYETPYGQMRYHDIEDLFGNVMEKLEGIYINTSNLHHYVTADPSAFGNSVSGKNSLPWMFPSSDEITAFGWDNNNPFLFMPILSVSNNHYDTYFCDKLHQMSGSTLMAAGARYDSMNKETGLTCCYCQSYNSSSDYIGTRLIRF